ncbi:MAG: isoamylase early set domain-containing protein [Desulfobacteraceae bacterium]|nr:MAG: isoamylase early set domain-containing protein [Desulfobacteraceae bacterium]
MIHKTTGQVPIVFTYVGQCETVCLSGDFNGWSPNIHCLKRNGDTWEIKLFLSPGPYKYAFLLDGTHWIPDPDAYLQEDDGFGTKNSVLIVE